MSQTSPVVGLLALQGDYQKHAEILNDIGVENIEVRKAEDFSRIDRLIIPGGESTTMLDLLNRFNLEDSFRRFISEKPVWGTCAGMILLAREVKNFRQKSYRSIDIVVDRNGYGRQYFSTVEPVMLNLNGKEEQLDLVFIRAPRVIGMGDGVKVLLKWNNDPVLLSQNNVLVSSFHPELTKSTLLHKYFAYDF